MSAVGGAGAIVLAVWLLTAAAAKAVDREAARSALQAVGVPERWAWSLGRLVPGVEAAVAVALLLAPGAAPTQAALVGVFGVFAAAGAAALVRGETVACACFGATGTSGTLGWRQVGQLAPVLVVAAVLASADAPWDATTGAVVLGWCVLAAAGLHLAAAARDWRRVRAERVSLAEARSAAKWLAARPSDA